VKRTGSPTRCTETGGNTGKGEVIDMKVKKIKVEVGRQELDEVIEKSEHLCELLKEAKSLANDLASTEIKILFDIDV
jgi:hypothetical protein